MRNEKCLWKDGLAAIGRGYLSGKNQSKETVVVVSSIRLVVVLKQKKSDRFEIMQRMNVQGFMINLIPSLMNRKEGLNDAAEILSLSGGRGVVSLLGKMER